MSAFHTSQLPDLRSSEIHGFANFLVGPSLQIPKKTVDKFASLLFFWVGLSLQNPKKTADKSKFHFFLGEPII